MTQSPTPVPLEPKPAEPPKKINIAQAAARASLFGMAMAFAVGFFSSRTGLTPDDSFGRTAVLIGGGTSILLALIAIGAGVTALLLMVRHGRRGVLMPSIGGIAGSCILLLLFAVGFSLAMARSNRNRVDALRDQKLNTAQKAAFDRVERAQKTGDMSQVNGALDDVDKTLDDISKGAGEQEKKIIAGQKQFLKRLQAVVEDYQKAVEAFQATGGLDPASLKEAKDANPRIEKLDAWAKANDAMDTFYENYEQAAKSDMVAAGVPEKPAGEIANRGAQSAMIGLAHQVRECDRDIIAAARAKLVILRDHWGKWEVRDVKDNEYDEDLVMFTDGNDDIAARYNLEHKKLVEAAAKQSKTQAEILAKARASAGTPAPLGGK